MTYRDIVVIGASAGGVETLSTLVAGLPRSFPAPIFVVLHIPPHTPSQLHRILAKAGHLPVIVPRDGDPFTPGNIYVASRDRHLVLEANRIRVTRGPKENRARPAIDTLFRSAAYTFGRQVVGVILSGMLDDGTSGLWTIKDRGGMAIVQSPHDALYPSMPESALAHVAVDAAVPVAEMGALLEKVTQEPIEAKTSSTSSSELHIETRIALEGNGLQGGVMKLGPVSSNTCPDCHGVLVRVREGSIVRYRCHTGHAFSLQTLLADVNEEIDTTLWNAIRSIEERILLLREISQAALQRNDAEASKHCDGQASIAEQDVERIRELVLSHQLFGRISGHGSSLSREDTDSDSQREQ